MTENCKRSISIPVLCYNNTVDFHFAIKKHLDVIKDKMFFVQCITLICILYKKKTFGPDSNIISQENSY